MNPKKPGLTPMENRIEFQDYSLEWPQWSLESLRSSALELRLPRPRSLAWAILLEALPPPNGDIVNSIKRHRNHYEELRKKLSLDPRVVIGDDPLSQNDESAWNQHFCDEELKALILQDVVRTFPDELYFRDKDVQDMMVRVLFSWARTHTHVGYRQGMHELLAPVLLELHVDRQLATGLASDTLALYLKDDALEHDSYMLFSAVMRSVERFYTTGDIAPSACGRMPVSKVVHNPNEVVRYLERVREEYLLRIDGELAEHLAECGVGMELFGIRWLRLLFGREFPRREVPPLWGFVFAEGPALPQLHYLIVATLVAMRSTLLDPEPAVVLSTLMRPCRAPSSHVAALARHLRAPARHARPDPPASPPFPTSPVQNGFEVVHDQECASICEGQSTSWSNSDSEGVPEGCDVSRALATLAVLRNRLPKAARELHLALGNVDQTVRRPLNEILQLANLLECRNHTLLDVETALEAAEAQNLENIPRKQIVPVSLIKGTFTAKSVPKSRTKKEVQMKLFHRSECANSNGFPFLDPLRLRTE